MLPATIISASTFAVFAQLFMICELIISIFSGSIDDVTAEMERIEKEKEANPFYDIKLGLTGEDEDESGNNKTSQ